MPATLCTRPRAPVRCGRCSPPTAEALVLELAALRDDHVAGRLVANLGGRAYAMEAFDEARLTSDLVALVRDRA